MKCDFQHGETSAAASWLRNEFVYCELMCTYLFQRLMTETDKMKSLLERTTAELKTTVSLLERTASTIIID